MNFVDLKTFGQPHDWEEYDFGVRQCHRCGEIQRTKLGEEKWYTTLAGLEHTCDKEKR